MARVALTTQESSRDGVVPTATAIPADGVSFKNNNVEFLLLNNTHTATVVVTIKTDFTADGLAIADRTITMGIGEERIVGPFPSSPYNKDGGDIEVDAATADVVKCSVFKLALL